MPTPTILAIIAGNGIYPQLMVRAARAAGVARIAVAAFHGETDPQLAEVVDEIEWMRVGQLGKMIAFLKKSGASHAVMSGQIHPSNLFALRPDLKAVVVLACPFAAAARAAMARIERIVVEQPAVAGTAATGAGE